MLNINLMVNQFPVRFHLQRAIAVGVIFINVVAKFGFARFVRVSTGLVVYLYYYVQCVYYLLIHVFV